jgi:NDP-sugar pyrophosphorylase family protein
MSGELNIVGVISAGWTPSQDDPLAEYTQGKPKAVIPIAGRPMVSYVVHALAGSRYVKHLVIVALDPTLDLQFSVPVEHVPDAGGLLANAEAGLQYALNRYPDLDAVLMCSSDVPTITSSIIDAYIEECLQTDHDLYYTVVERSVMEARFPESRRSYVHLREGDFAGGDVFLMRPSLTVSHRDLLRELAAARKSVLRQARMIGLPTFLKLVLRRLSLNEAVQRVSQVLNLYARVVPFTYAEVGMDVDKPFQLEIVRAELEARTANAS